MSYKLFFHARRNYTLVTRCVRATRCIGVSGCEIAKYFVKLPFGLRKLYLVLQILFSVDVEATTSVEVKDQNDVEKVELEDYFGIIFVCTN